MKTGDRASFLVMPSPPDPMQELVEAAREEGQLTVIGCPRDWSGYGEIIDSFTSRFGLTVNELFPQASSLDEVDTIRQARDNPSPLSPDVVEIGQSFAPEARRDGLLQPYRVSTWETLPDTARDPDGFWYAGGSGMIVFEVNLDVVEKAPRDWVDLAEAEFRRAVALPGDRTSEQAGRAIFAAGLSVAAAVPTGPLRKGCGSSPP
jgi:putative spermidine/putrescine transport system substrate-binding protein